MEDPRVMISLDRQKVQKIVDRLTEAISPSVTFSNDFEKMKKSAEDITRTNIVLAEDELKNLIKLN